MRASAGTGRGWELRHKHGHLSATVIAKRTGYLSHQTEINFVSYDVLTAQLL